MKRAVLAFLAGFLATLIFHQAVVWLFHTAHMTERTPWGMKGVPPFGVPAVISLAFWGGVWGVIMIPLIARARGAGWWVAATVFGAVFPTLVAGYVIAPLRGQNLAGGGGKLVVFGLAVNAAWGLGTALFYRLFGGK
jgi:uncharacterized membrane protein